MDSVIRLVSSVSTGAAAICRAAGLQQTLPKFHSLLLIWLLIKKKTVMLATPQGRRHAYGYEQGEGEREKTMTAKFHRKVKCKE